MSQAISKAFGVFAVISLVLSIGAFSLAAVRSGTAGPSGAAGLPGTNGAQGPQGPPGTSWRTGNYTNCVLSSSSGSVTNCASLTFTAPQAGFVWLQSSGYCNTPQGNTFTQIRIGWSTLSSVTPGILHAVAILHVAGEPIGTSRESYSTSTEFSVVSGLHAYYLNAVDDLGTGGFSCSGTNILMFTTTQLS